MISVRPSRPHPALVELEQCRELLAFSDREPVQTSTKLASRFLGLTAVRLEAMRGMRWGEIEGGAKRGVTRRPD